MDRPNLLVFMTDHQRGDTVLAEHPCLTPNLDRFAAEGVAFTEAYCPTPHCCPSRATFFTGLYPSGHGVWNNICNRQALSTGLNPRVRLWSEDLAAAGYDLHFSGKWHVSVEESPEDRGWTEHFLSGAAGTHHGVTWDHYEKEASEPEPERRGEGEILRPGYGTYRLYGPGGDEGNRHDETAVSRGLEALDSLGGRREPWGLYVGAIAPHDPYVVPQRYLDLYDLDRVPLPASYGDAMEDKPRIYQRLRQARFGQLSGREVREGIRHFWAYCSYLDDLFGRLLAGLEETGHAENTVVVYCADHGDYCGEHGLFAKGIPSFRGAYHIPAVVRWPAGIARPGRRVAELVSLADFGPTFLDLAGIRTDRHFTGRSLAPFLRGEAPPAWRDAIHTQCDGVELYYTQRSVRTRDWKYVFNGFDRDELYDLRADPDEMVNREADPACEAVKRELCGRLWRFAREEDDTAINPYITVGLAPYGPAEGFRSGT
ncbi:MAG: sulfatase-like hydrolase/transferase [Gemmatimonadota bacterium]